MSIHINAGKTVRRGDLFFVDPFEIQVKEELRGRHTPPSDDDIISMAESMLTEGQIQPVECRRVAPDNKLMLTVGFTRCAAARLIREGFKGTDGTDKGDPEFALQVKVVECNDEKAFRRNVVENAHRNATSPIDDAFNQEKLRDRYGMLDADIARLYGYTSQSKVGMLRKLLQHDKAVQDMVHVGSLGVAAAVEMLELPTEEMKKLLAETTQNGKVSGSDVRTRVRDHILSDHDASAESSTGSRRHSANGSKKKHRARSVREIRTYFEARKSQEGTTKHVKEFVSTFLKFLSGRCTDAAMETAFEKFTASKGSK